MKLRIGHRVWLVISLLLFLFFSTSAVSYMLTKRIEDSVNQLAYVDDVSLQAVTTMDARLEEIVRATTVYALNAGDVDREHLKALVFEFSNAATTYMRLSTVADQRRLANDALKSFTVLHQLSDEIIVVSDRSRAETAALRSAQRAIESAIDKRILDLVDRTGGVSKEKLIAVLGMDTSFDGVVSGFEDYLDVPDAAVREKVLSHSTEFNAFINKFLAAGPTVDERDWAEGIRDRISSLSTAGAGVMHLIDRKQDLLVRISDRHSELKRYLVLRITPHIETARVWAGHKVNLSTFTAIWFLLAMTGVGVVMGAGAAVMLTRGIVKPIEALTEGTDAIGQGNLEHRIAIQSDDELGRLAAAFNRMAENRQQSEEALRNLAHHDPLTQLPNRALFHERLTEALDTGGRVNRMVAVHFLDLDHFKDVNDTLGHPAGDLLLQQVSERLKACLRKSDTVARLGGDEFAVIQTNLVDDSGITVLAERMVEALTTPFDLGDERVHTGTSVGITVFPQDGTVADNLLKNADQALYRAKQEGRAKYRLFDPNMNAEIQARKTLEIDLREALESEGQIFLTYQPQIEIATGRIAGVEALVRWHHPERGMISPGEFIPVAEQTRLIGRITEIVLREACRQGKAWRDDGLPDMRMSVNLSPADFKRHDVVDMITGILDDTGFDPHLLELEITEGMVMSGVEAVIETLHKLHAIGVELAIDDFGTGFSSMSYLKKFPVDRLKIDQSFMRGIENNVEDRSITKAIIKLGHSLGLKVIAEGVETEEQMEFLRIRHCQEAQGYLISRPIEAEELAEFIRGYSPQVHAVEEKIA